MEARTKWNLHIENDGDFDAIVEGRKRAALVAVGEVSVGQLIEWRDEQADRSVITSISHVERAPAPFVLVSFEVDDGRY